MTQKLHLVSLALVAAICWPVAAKAALIVNDTWRDGTDSDPASPTYSENGVDSDADGDIESLWYRGGGGTLDPVGPGGPERGTGFGTSSASWTDYFTAEGSEVNLANIGDSMKLTWQFKTGDVNASNTSQNFRLALMDSPSAARLAADGSPGSGAFAGYAIFGNMAETFGRNAPFQLMQRAGASGAFLGTSGDWVAVGTGGGTNGNPGYADNTNYTLVWTITHNASNNLDITATMTGGNIDNAGSVTATATNVAPNNGSCKFDTFGLRPSTAATTADTFDMTLFRIEKNVPEPAAIALAGMAGLGLLASRRRG